MESIAQTGVSLKNNDAMNILGLHMTTAPVLQDARLVLSWYAK
jgi:hypothetical protein